MSGTAPRPDGRGRRPAAAPPSSAHNPAATTMTRRPGHDGMVGAAELGTGKVEDAGLVGVEPKIGVAVGQDVLLEPQRRQIEIVDDILRRHRQPHVGAGRHVQLVDFACAAWVLDAPHPLFGNDVDFEGFVRRRLAR